MWSPIELFAPLNDRKFNPHFYFIYSSYPVFCPTPSHRTFFHPLKIKVTQTVISALFQPVVFYFVVYCYFFCDDWNLTLYLSNVFIFSLVLGYLHTRVHCFPLLSRSILLHYINFLIFSPPPRLSTCQVVFFFFINYLLRLIKITRQMFWIN